MRTFPGLFLGVKVPKQIVSEGRKCFYSHKVKQLFILKAFRLSKDDLFFPFKNPLHDKMRKKEGGARLN